METFGCSKDDENTKDFFYLPKLRKSRICTERLLAAVNNWQYSDIEKQLVNFMKNSTVTNSENVCKDFSTLCFSLNEVVRYTKAATKMFCKPIDKNKDPNCPSLTMDQRWSILDQATVSGSSCSWRLESNEEIDECMENALFFNITNQDIAPYCIFKFLGWKTGKQCQETDQE